MSYGAGVLFQSASFALCENAYRRRPADALPRRRLDGILPVCCCGEHSVVGQPRVAQPPADCVIWQVPEWGKVFGTRHLALLGVGQRNTDTITRLKCTYLFRGEMCVTLIWRLGLDAIISDYLAPLIIPTSVCV